MPYLIKADIELQAVVPLNFLKEIGERGLREVSIKQDTEFGFERHFDKTKIDKNKIDINFGFGKLIIKAKDLKEALKRANILG